MHDRTATRQRVGGRTRGRGDDESVTHVRVYVSAVDPRTYVDHATGFALCDDDVVQGERIDGSAVRQDLRREQHSPLGLAAAGECIVEALQHLLGTDVRQESESAAVDAKHGDVGHGGHPRGMQHGAVAADCDDQVGAGRELGFGHGVDACAVQRQRLVRNDAHGVAFAEQVLGERAHGFAHARIDRTASEGDTGSAGRACVHRVACLLAWGRAHGPARFQRLRRANALLDLPEKHTLGLPWP